MSDKVWIYVDGEQIACTTNATLEFGQTVIESTIRPGWEWILTVEGPMVYCNGNPPMPLKPGKYEPWEVYNDHTKAIL